MANVRREHAPYDELSEDDVLALQEDNLLLRDALAQAIDDHEWGREPDWVSLRQAIIASDSLRGIAHQPPDAEPEQGCDG